jgi:orotidine-5'-phosphate decarboxylase
MMPVPTESIIVALDTDAHTAISLARSLSGRVRYVKIGMTLYYAEGPVIVERMRDLGYEVFLDLKLHDIPHQVRGAAREIARLGVAMFTVHASGGVDMMQAAVQGACEGSGECGVDTPDVLAVSVLTSSDDEMLKMIGIERGAAEQVDLLVGLARAAGVQGVVCSPLEAGRAKRILGPEALVVTPGVRPAGTDVDDQARTATPEAALEAGATHLVIGRPITAATNPAAAIESLIGTM